ncbi:MAG: hypothetical protein IKL91_05495 [Bacteroidales bacterium]|nr:hypothetical protein [Bacteroidales bacterium]
MMEMRPVVGLDFKLKITQPTINDKYNLSNTEWSVDVFVSSSSVLTIEKDEAKKVDDNNYLIPVESSKLGAGKYYTILTIKVPDSDFAKGYRTESWQRYSGVTVYKRYEV